ncbi:MAG: SMC-Scp complex subunit ScpB [Bacteroidetes bacterium]|nr:SMC-Scp complex subunit ScpB [Bacteroidota bacterium]MCY4205347.1 SMC-Scp complex subunit ScpB [Bacteroidota bacterium]
MSTEKKIGFDNRVSLAMVLEALAFASETPVSVDQVCNIYAELSGDDAIPNEKAVEDALETLNASFEKEGHALRIHTWAGGLRMATTSAVAPFLEAFFRRERARRLTRPLMETLAIIAYKQPSTRAEIDAIRGVDSGYSIRKLLSLNLVAITGRAEVAGRPMLYATTNRFLEEFGIKDLNGLPTLREAEELLGDTNFDQERLRLLVADGASSIDQKVADNSLDDTKISSQQELLLESKDQ